MAEEVFPIIDLSSTNGNFELKSVEILDACKNWGFMILTGYGVSQEDVDRMYKLNQGFCSLPQDVKSEFNIDQRLIGYDLKHSKIGANEGMVFGGIKGEIADRRDIHAYWDLAKREEVERFKETCHTVAQKLMRVFATSFGLPPDYFVDAHDSSKSPGSALRMLHYPKMGKQPEPGIPRLYEHTDYGSLTFVWPQSGGLEVRTPSDKWLEVPLVPGGVVVNIGDALSLWSGVTLKSTLHKISFDNLPIDKSRWSMAYFINANEDARLEVLKKASDGTMTHQPGDAVMTAGDYIKARMYLSQKGDAANNWVGSASAEEIDKYQSLLDVVEKIGVSNRAFTTPQVTVA